VDVDVDVDVDVVDVVDVDVDVDVDVVESVLSCCAAVVPKLSASAHWLPYTNTASANLAAATTSRSQSPSMSRATVARTLKATLSKIVALNRAIGRDI